MKREALLLPALAILLILSSCQEDKPETVHETGELIIHLGLQVHEYQASAGMKSAPAVGDFRVHICLADGSIYQVFDRAADMPEAIELPTGDYFVEAWSDNRLPAAFENPYYEGVSGLFTIESNLQQQVELSCALANTAVSVAYSDQVLAAFTNMSTTVSSEQGSLTFVAGEMRRAYFEPLPLNVQVNLEYLKPDGTAAQKTLGGNIPDPQPARLYELVIDASIDEGMASFEIVLDSSMSVELVEISGAASPPLPGAVAYGDLIITEIMANPTALSDTEGEWFEIYNASGNTISLQNLVIRRDDTNEHGIGEDLNLEPGAYMVLQRTATASAASNNYVYGSSITLSNSGAELGIYNEDQGGGPGALIFAVNYGTSGFPEGSGASIALDPAHLNATAAQLGSHWCISSSAFSTGDLGTPGLENDICQ